MDVAETAYLAGFFDGEGCIGMYVHRSNGTRDVLKHEIIAQVAGIDEPSIRRFLVLGGYVRGPLRSPGLGRRPIWRWRTSGRATQRALEQLLPYLRVKREQAIAVLEVRLGVKGHAIARDELRRRIAITSRLAELKREAA